ncbi:MAG TPA: glycosyltransferase family 2 protein [Flavipsychrobacter sp.]|nr:glycosyltransferase family 2 protein [Flavipsychrobacter sp.]
MIGISVVIITHNEEQNISNCIKSVENIADEIIVVDSYSNDNTIQIAKNLGAKVILHPFNGFGEQKCFAAKQATNDWILSLDADEVISPELEKSILDTKKQQPLFDAYNVSIFTNYCGKWIKHCGWFPQKKIRFWNRNKGEITKSIVHEGLVMHDKGNRVGSLKGNLLHYSYKTISDHIHKIEYYTELAAQKEAAEGNNISLLKLWIGPKWKFFYHYILRMGFLDGYYGYVISKNAAFGGLIKYAKIRQLTRARKQKKLF